MNCNYCRYQEIKKLAKKEGNTIMKSGRNTLPKLGGINIIVYPKNEVPPSKGSVERREFEEKYFTEWYMELPHDCCCDD